MEEALKFASEQLAERGEEEPLVLEELEVDDFADLLREEVLDLLPLGLKIDTMAHKVAVI